MPTLYIAITNHGFGHATRTAALMAEVKRRLPEVEMIFATQVPRWLLQSYLRRADFEQRPVGLDVGVVQTDSLTMNKPATLEKLRQLQQQEAQIVAAEVQVVQQRGVDLILADVPPLAMSIAHQAGIPCWAASNFGWDFIYRPWGGEFVEIADWIGERYGGCDRLFRLPFHEQMTAFSSMTDVGLTGGDPCYDPDELRTQFKITAPPERTVLITFGGMGVDRIPYHNLAQFPDWQFITFDSNPPDLPNLIKTTNPPFRPVDLMQLCGSVICKPGYGTFSEAYRMGVGVISLVRQDFAEAPVLVEQICQCHPHRILEPMAFLRGDWSFLREPLHSPTQSQPLRTDGNPTIADAIITYLKSHGAC